MKKVTLEVVHEKVTGHCKAIWLNSWRASLWKNLSYDLILSGESGISIRRNRSSLKILEKHTA